MRLHGACDGALAWQMWSLRHLSCGRRAISHHMWALWHLDDCVSGYAAWSKAFFFRVVQDLLTFATEEAESAERSTGATEPELGQTAELYDSVVRHDRWKSMRMMH